VFFAAAASRVWRAGQGERRERGGATFDVADAGKRARPQEPIAAFRALRGSGVGVFSKAAFRA